MKLKDARERIRTSLDRLWVDRAKDMFDSMTISNTCMTTVSQLRVPAQWPIKGKITFTRDADGKKVRLFYNKKEKKFKADSKCKF